MNFQSKYFVVYLFKIVSSGVLKVFAILVVVSLNLGFVETSDASTVYTLSPVLSAFASPGATAVLHEHEESVVGSEETGSDGDDTGADVDDTGADGEVTGSDGEDTKAFRNLG